ncbi:hypothetical protein [Streptomyces sp. HUAS ZL42]|uniref:hypothetical protein n=1 Tax=Streptomyces sp. HUAS ZL42 TaxID=3231715 RepID=UPI00345F0212
MSRAVAVGARFVVFAGFDEASATKLMRAPRAGLDPVNLFPAEPLGGIPLLRALPAPSPIRNLGF